MNEKSNDNYAIIPNQNFEPIRQRFDIQIGAIVQSNEATYRIIQVLDFGSAIGIEVEGGRCAPLRIGDLRPATDVINDLRNDDLVSIGDEDWRIAQERFAAIKPLLHLTCIGRHEVEHRAKEVGADTAIVYHWVNTYKKNGVISALIPKKRSWQEGESRIFAKGVIEAVIKDSFLTPQRPSAAQTVTEVFRRCQMRGIDAPHSSMIRARFSVVTENCRLRSGRGCMENSPALSFIDGDIGEFGDIA